MKQRDVNIQRLKMIAKDSEGSLSGNSATVTIPIAETTIGVTAGIYYTWWKSHHRHHH